MESRRLRREIEHDVVWTEVPQCKSLLLVLKYQSFQDLQKNTPFVIRRMRQLFIQQVSEIAAILKLVNHPETTCSLYTLHVLNCILRVHLCQSEFLISARSFDFRVKHRIWELLYKEYVFELIRRCSETLILRILLFERVEFGYVHGQLSSFVYLSANSVVLLGVECTSQSLLLFFSECHFLTR